MMGARPALRQATQNRPNNNNNGNAAPDNAASQANNAPEKAKEEEEEAFVYRSDGVRDPFAPFIVNVTDDDPKERCALCVPLANLTFTGVVTGIASPVALVETREGVGYFVRRGSELRLQRGASSTSERGSSCCESACKTSSAGSLSSIALCVSARKTRWLRSPQTMSHRDL